MREHLGPFPAGTAVEPNFAAMEAWVASFASTSTPRPAATWAPSRCACSGDPEDRGDEMPMARCRCHRRVSRIGRPRMRNRPPHPEDKPASHSAAGRPTSHAVITPSVKFACADLVVCRWTEVSPPGSVPLSTLTCETPGQRGCAGRESCIAQIASRLAKHLVDARISAGGAGGNRTRSRCCRVVTAPERYCRLPGLSRRFSVSACHAECGLVITRL